MQSFQGLTLTELSDKEKKLTENIIAIKSELASLEAQGVTYRVYYQEMAQELRDCERDLKAVQAQINVLRARKHSE